MRNVFCLILLAACELQPAPKKQPAPVVQPAPAEKVVEAPRPPPAGSGSAVPAVKIEITAQCLEVAAKVAQVFIDSATDPAQKSIYEQERANMTRKTGEACTVQAWNDDARKCYLATKTPAEIKACELKYPTPATVPQPAQPIRVEPVQAPGTPPAAGVPAPKPNPTVVIPPPAQPKQPQPKQPQPKQP